LRGVPRAFGFTFVLLGLLLASLRVAAAFPIACLGRGTGFPGSLWALLLPACSGRAKCTCNNDEQDAPAKQASTRATTKAADARNKAGKQYERTSV
jgi:hypothetical protein